MQSAVAGLMTQVKGTKSAMAVTVVMPGSIPPMMNTKNILYSGIIALFPPLPCLRASRFSAEMVLTFFRDVWERSSCPAFLFKKARFVFLGAFFGRYSAYRQWKKKRKNLSPWEGLDDRRNMCASAHVDCQEMS